MLGYHVIALGDKTAKKELFRLFKKLMTSTERRLSMFSELIDRIVTYGTPAFLIAKDLIERLVKNPELTKIATEKMIQVAKGGRTRGDEMLFLASFISFREATAKDKQLFLDKHYELLHPNFMGKNADEKELKKKKALAKGVIFLISEDRSCVISDPTKSSTEPMFQMAHKIWEAIFMGIKDAPDDQSKLQIFEKRIVHFGKNHQEGKTLKQLVLSVPEKLKPTWDKADSAAEKVGNIINSTTDWIDSQYSSRSNRRELFRKMPLQQKILPWNVWRRFLDQF